MAVLDKSITEKCNCCGICVAACPQDVFRIDEARRKSSIRYPNDCVACGVCEFFCSMNCLKVTLERPRRAPFPY
jgi:NAD-dependent dihydropyrimidine dehydrogenase PreA subunit